MRAFRGGRYACTSARLPVVAPSTPHARAPLAAWPSQRKGEIMQRMGTLCFVLALGSAHAAQLDIVGPSGSGHFGSGVYVLPNDNVVVTDPDFSPAGISAAGAVYLYTPNGSLISTLTGSSANDH